MSEVRIDGGWLGTYYYGPEYGDWPVRFEALFTSIDSGRFRGTVIDDGPLGEATAIGRQLGRRVEFVKTYSQNMAGFTQAPVAYEGTIDEDGKTMRGAWRLKVKEFGVISRVMKGTWDAHRTWREEEASECRRDEVADAVGTPVLR